jgi:Tfp pilus assembly protein PilP
MKTLMATLVLATVPSMAFAQAPVAAPATPAAQAPAAQPPAGPGQPAAAPAQTPPPPATPSENYSYDPAGRRDPFMSLIGAGSEPRMGAERPEGPAGIAVAELSVRGVMKSGGTLIAIILGPDTRTYVVHSGDKLLDGVIKAVTAEGLVITQEVNDPLSLVKQREVVKRLRSQEDAK